MANNSYGWAAPAQRQSAPASMGRQPTVPPSSAGGGFWAGLPQQDMSTGQQPMTMREQAARGAAPTPAGPVNSLGGGLSAAGMPGKQGQPIQAGAGGPNQLNGNGNNPFATQAARQGVNPMGSGGDYSAANGMANPGQSSGGFWAGTQQGQPIQPGRGGPNQMSGDGSNPFNTLAQRQAVNSFGSGGDYSGGGYNMGGYNNVTPMPGGFPPPSGAPINQGEIPPNSRWQLPTNNTGNDIMRQWQEAVGGGDIEWWRNTRNAGAGQAMANSMMIPLLNAQNAARTQAMNEEVNRLNFGETQRVNSHQMGMADSANWRENEALRFGQETNRRDFGETQRQFNQNLGWQQELGRGQMRNDMFGRQTDRMNINNQFQLGQHANATNRMNINNQFQLGQHANATNRMNVQNQFQLGQGQLSNDRFANQTQRQMGMGRLDLDRDVASSQLRQSRDRLTLDSELGRGQLGFQNRELDLNNTYRNTALAQEGALARERMQSDLTQARYGAFGRAQAPSARTAMSWY